MKRELKQAWTGLINRGHFPININDLVKIQENSMFACKEFLTANNIEPLIITFEDLIVMPEKTINSLNKFLGLSLNMEDLGLVYKGKVHEKRWNSWDYCRAMGRFFYYSKIKKDTIRFPRI
jgi:hypothetical protein